MDIPKSLNTLHIEGTFYRAIDPLFRDFALNGSRNPGRYSRIDQPTLYLSSSVEGVKTAMIAHRNERTPSLEIMAFDVNVTGIFDLQDDQALKAAGISRQDAIAPWQEIVQKGGIPPSWKVRDRLQAYGVKGVIDPSRKSPGLWHLVLFEWNAGIEVSASKTQ